MQTLSRPLAYRVMTTNTRALSLTYCVRPKDQERTVISKKLFLEFLEKSRGVISIVCEKTDISRATYYHWRNTDPEFKTKVDEILNSKPDILEDRLYHLALGGNPTALMFMLRHKHPDYKNGGKNSKIDIHHYVHKENPKMGGFSLEDVIDQWEATAPEHLQLPKDSEDSKEGKSV